MVLFKCLRHCESFPMKYFIGWSHWVESVKFSPVSLSPFTICYAECLLMGWSRCINCFTPFLLSWGILHITVVFGIIQTIIKFSCSLPGLFTSLHLVLISSILQWTYNSPLTAVALLHCGHNNWLTSYPSSSITTDWIVEYVNTLRCGMLVIACTMDTESFDMLSFHN